MPRMGRIVQDNAVYHILNRGHDRRKLFPSSADLKAFKEINEIGDVSFRDTQLMSSRVRFIRSHIFSTNLQRYTYLKDF